MSKLKSYLLAFLVASVFATAAHAADAGSTKFKNLTVTGTTSLATTTYTGPLLPYPRTLAQINALTSGTTGQMVVVTDGVMTKICISSGTTAAGQWTVTQGTAAALAPLHCQ